MFYLFGNCQMDFLCQALLGQGEQAEHRPVASPLTLEPLDAQETSGGDDSALSVLTSMQRRYGIENYMHGRTLRNQFQLFDAADPAPDAIVVNLFHENTPLFVHKPDSRVFFVDPACWNAVPEIETWMKASCQQIKPNPLKYLHRFTTLLERLASIRPGVPLLVVTRLLTYPAFGPGYHAYLEEWTQLQQILPEAIAFWEANFPNIHVLDPNRILGGIWNRATAKGRSQRVEEHCPFLRIHIEPDDPALPPQRMEIKRDLEHIATLWPVLARKVVDFAHHGTVRYTPEEEVPECWMQPWNGPERPDVATLEGWLRTGSNYQCARAVGELLLTQRPDGWRLLVAAAPHMPVCHNTLHMIDKLSRIQKDSIAADWCRLHAAQAKRFDANGELFRRLYLERLEQIASRVADTPASAPVVKTVVKAVAKAS